MICLILHHVIELEGLNDKPSMAVASLILCGTSGIRSYREKALLVKRLIKPQNKFRKDL